MIVATGEIGGSKARGMSFGRWDDPTSRSEATGVEVGKNPTYGIIKEAAITTIEAAIVERPFLVVMTAAGALDSVRRRIIAAGNIHACVNQPLLEDLQNHFGCQVLLCNDAEALGHAEARYGQGQGKTFGGRILGSGFGGCKVVALPGDGYVVYASEPGHITVDYGDDGPTCGCGKRNHSEAWLGGSSIEQNEGVRAENLSAEQWEIRERVWAVAEASLHQVNLDEELVIYGGTGGINESHRFDRIRTIANHEYAMVPVPEIVPTVFGHDAGLIGALAYAAIAPEVVLPRPLRQS